MRLQADRALLKRLRGWNRLWAMQKQLARQRRRFQWARWLTLSLDRFRRSRHAAWGPRFKGRRGTAGEGLSCALAQGALGDFSAPEASAHYRLLALIASENILEALGVRISSLARTNARIVFGSVKGQEAVGFERSVEAWTSLTGSRAQAGAILRDRHDA